MAEADDLIAQIEALTEKLGKAKQSITGRFVGQEQVVDLALTALLCGGHGLLIGLPGLGKTRLVETLSTVMGLHGNRVQFTPDLMPADILGSEVLDTAPDGSRAFRFIEGPIFCQLLMADEINRASPRTQSALLQAMQEKTVTVAGQDRALGQPFHVLATQNPIEQEGTYPLPEAQLDRFMFKVVVGGLDREELNEVVSRTILKRPISLPVVLDGDAILKIRETLDKVVVADPLRDYAVRLVLATHPNNEDAPDGIKRFVRWGASPRAAQALIKAARVRALAEGRAHVGFDDIDTFATEVLQHRVLLNYDGQAEDVDVAALVADCLDSLEQSN